MYPVHATQIKAARAMLGWSQEKLADEANLAINTIRNLETGAFSPRNTTNVNICQAFAKVGLEFIEDQGVRFVKDEVKVFEGRDSREIFFDDMLQTVKQKGGDIICAIHSQEIMMLSFGIANRDGLGQLEQLSRITKVKCLLSEAPESPFLLPSFEFRAISKLNVGPLLYYVYGDKHALVLLDGGEDFKFIILKSISWAQEYREHFSALWDSAIPLPAPTPSFEQHSTKS